MRATDDILSALGLLSRLPLLRYVWRGPQSVWAFPIAGIVLAGAAGAVAAILLAFGMPSAGAAIILLGLLVAMTGALHEDGLADCADGFWGGRNPERRLEIMRDSRVGSYGVIALVLSLLARWWALTLLLAAPSDGLWAILGAAALSRALMVPLMTALPHARPDGLARSIGHPEPALAAGAVAVGVVFGWLTMGFWPVVVGAAVAWGIARLARAKIAGQTGDVLGATQQATEVAMLLCLTLY